MNLRVYNPRDCSPEALEALTVGREPILAEILGDLHRQAREHVRQPWLLHAPRGFGKTHLLALLNRRIIADAESKGSLLPIWLPESDAYVAFDIRSFLDQVLLQLADALPRGFGAAARIRQVVEAEPSQTGIALREECLAAEAQRAGVTFVVLYENFDALATVFDRSTASRDSKRLRAILTQPKYPLFVFTTAMERIDAVDLATRPMHQLFRSSHLSPLTESDAADLFRRIHSTAHVRYPAGQTADLEPWDHARIRTFHQLTGGSPRSIMIAIAAIGTASGIDALVDELKSLLDVNTPTFEQRLSDLAPRERAIVSALALAPTTLTLQEIAGKSGLPERSLSTQVERLVDAGWVAVAFDTGGKGSLYEIRDGLFRVWYQYRRGDRVLGPLVRFLALWFPPEELKASFDRVHKQSEGKESSSLLHLLKAQELSAQPEFQAERQSILSAYIAQDARLFTGSEPPGVDSPGESEATTLTVVRQLSQSADDFVESGRWDEAIALYDELVSQFGDASAREIRVYVAWALYDRGSALIAIGRRDDGIASHDEVVRRFGDAPEIMLRQRAAAALVDRGNAFVDAGRHAEALASYDEVVRRFGQAPEAELREMVAWALVFRGDTLGKTSRLDDEIATYDEAVRKLGDVSKTEVPAVVALALFSRGAALEKAGRHDDGIAAYDEVVRRFGDAQEFASRDLVARSLIKRGSALQHTGRGSEALASYEEVVRRFGNDSQTKSREQVAWALLIRAEALIAMARPDEAIAAYDEVIRRLGEAHEIALRPRIADALISRGNALGEIGRRDDGMKSYDEVVRRFGDSSEVELREQVATALNNRAIDLAFAERWEDTIATCDEVVRRFGDASEFDIRVQVARALLRRGDALGEIDRRNDGIASYDEVVRRFGDSSEVELREQVATALNNRAVDLAFAERWEDTIATCDEIVRRFGDASDVVIRVRVARALIRRGDALGQIERRDDGIASYDEVVRRFGEEQEADLRTTVAAAVANLVEALAHVGDARRCREELDRLAACSTAIPAADRPPMHRAIEAMISAFAVPDARAWLAVFRESADEDLRATGRLCNYVIDVVEAGEAADSGTPRSTTPNVAKALARSPIEIRATVREIAARVRKNRRKFRRSGREK